MAKVPNARATHNPEAGSTFSKLLALAMGPGLALAVLIALGVHLVMNDRAGEVGISVAQQQSAGR